VSQWYIVGLLIAVLVVLGVMVYNAREERMLRSKLRRSFGSHEDALLQAKRTQVRDGKRHEPSFDPVQADRMAMPQSLRNAPPLKQAPIATNPSHASASPFRNTESTEGAKAPVLGALQPEPLPQHGLPVHPSLDFIIPIVFPKPTSLAKMPAFSARKSVMICTLNDRGVWSAVCSVARPYKQMNIALQLVDADGAIPEPALRQFAKEVQELAVLYQGRVYIPSIEACLANLPEVKAFYQSIDGLLAVNVSFEQPMMFKQLTSFLTEQGLHLAQDGSFNQLSEQGDQLYSVVDSSGSFQLHRDFSPVKSISLLFDIPRSVTGIRGLEALIDLAYVLKERFNVRLLNDQGQELLPPQLQALRDSVNTLFVNMAHQSLVPGSPVALRLFSA
jgi:hypothetical protein